MVIVRNEVDKKNELVIEVIFCFRFEILSLLKEIMVSVVIVVKINDVSKEISKIISFLIFTRSDFVNRFVSSDNCQID